MKRDVVYRFDLTHVWGFILPELTVFLLYIMIYLTSSVIIEQI